MTGESGAKLGKPFGEKGNRSDKKVKWKGLELRLLSFDFEWISIACWATRVGHQAGPANGFKNIWLELRRRLSLPSQKAA